MTFTDKILNRFGYVRKPEQRRYSMRSYQAADINRLTADFPSTPTAVDQNIIDALRTVRTRARYLQANNELARNFIRLVVRNVLGPHGFKFQSDVKERIMEQVEGRPKQKIVHDTLAETKIEEAWEEWTLPENCSVDGHTSWREMQELALKYACRDGEGFLRDVYDASAPFGYRLQLVPPESLDERFNQKLSSERIIKMGVEMNAWRRPLRYHFHGGSIEDELWDIYAGEFHGKRVPVRAADIRHLFVRDFSNQTRGISWIVPVMLSIHMLGKYDEAALVAARAGASKMGFITRSAETDRPLETVEPDEHGNVYDSFSPGSIGELEPGQDFTSFDPKYPDAAYGPFTKVLLRRIATGLGVSYNTWANDLEGVNYSSIRAGLLDERDEWKVLQMWMIERMLIPTFSRWLRMAIVSGRLALPITKIQKFNHPWFVGRRWAWVDPLKEIQAAILEIRAGLNTATNVIGERGWEIREVFSDLEEEKDLAKKHGLNLSVFDPSQKISGKSLTDGEKNNDEDGTSKQVEDDEEDRAMQVLLKVEEILHVHRDKVEKIIRNKNGVHDDA